METNNKLRNALAKILGIADHVQMRFAIPELANLEISELKQIAEAALAEPRRNCDVGTAEEADAAYRRFYEREIAKIPMDAVNLGREMAKIPTKDKWLFATATEKEG